MGLDAKTWKHIVAILAAVAAIALTFAQARNARKKSRTQDSLHKDLQGQAEGQADGTLSQAHRTLKGVLEDDVKHFSRVGTWWYVGLGGALATLIAEIIDTQVP